MAEAGEIAALDRRSRQRFVAMRRGEYCFWVVVDGRRHPLVDLSLEGFAMPVAPPCARGENFEFVLQRANVPDEIRGAARVANVLGTVSGAQAGCLFEPLGDDAVSRLQDWLVAHVIATATIPITEKDAIRIVSGPSLI